jgi:hypothetical protein
MKVTPETYLMKVTPETYLMMVTPETYLMMVTPETYLMMVIVLRAIKPKGLNSIVKIGQFHLCLREENLSLIDNCII